MPDSLPPKPNLMTMPTEMLLEIIRVTEQGSLLAFARCTKRLNSLITPYIYQSIHFVETLMGFKYQCARYPDWGSKHPKNYQTFGRGFRADTRVYDITKLLQTISSSRKLRSAIGAASFVWCNYAPFDDNMDEEILYITALLDKEGFKLHMAPRALDCTWFQFPWPKSLRSLELSVPIFSPSPERTGGRLYDIFCQTNLKQLTLKDIDEWGDLQVPFDKYPPRLSGLKCLKLSGASFPVDRTSPILTWPSALHSFGQEGLYYPTLPLNPSHWVEILYGHRKSLKEFFVSLELLYPKCNGLSMGSGLRAFENIKLLGVPWEFLIGKEQGSFFTHVDSHQILPPILEVFVGTGHRNDWKVVELTGRS